jgi:hypothetical protein
LQVPEAHVVNDSLVEPPAKRSLSPGCGDMAVTVTLQFGSAVKESTEPSPRTEETETSQPLRLKASAGALGSTEESWMDSDTGDDATLRAVHALVTCGLFASPLYVAYHQNVPGAENVWDADW